METDATLRVGQIVNDKYRVEDIIGSGGMGTVYRAVQMAISRPVAIKLMHHQYLNSTAAIERFRFEANLVGTVSSDNICEVIDFGMLNGRFPFIVMPLLRGCTLKELKATESISFKRALDIVQQSLLALQAVHDAGILHRDLKPENIFITQVGDRTDFVKLLDFGISKAFAQTSSPGSNRTGGVNGTPAYMSPEQALGSVNSGPQSDIYSMGVILYELVTGRRPHAGQTIAELTQQILEAPYLLPRKVNPHISSEFERVIIRALSKDPRDRFESAAIFRKSLRRVKEMQSTVPVVNCFSGPSESVSTLTGTMTLTQTISAAATEPPQTLARRPGRRALVTGFALGFLAVGVLIAAVLYVANQPEKAEATLSLGRPDSQLPLDTASITPPALAAPLLRAATPKQVPTKPTLEESPNPVDTTSRSADGGLPTPQRGSVKRKTQRILQPPNSSHDHDNAKIKGRFETEIISDYAD